MRILWMALLASHLLLYFVVAAHMLHEEAPPMPPHLAELLAAISLGVVVIAIVLPAKAIDQGLRNLDVETTNEVGEAVGSFRESAAVTKVVANPERAVLAALPRFQTPMIIGLALAESVSLFGFLLGLFGAPAWTWAPFFGVGIALTVIKFPRLSAITRAIERVKGARCDFTL